MPLAIVRDEAPFVPACDPILRWVGGKGWLVPLLAPVIAQQLDDTDGAYIEPFVGGAAIALALAHPNMILGDSCIPLITTYRAICKNPAAVAWSLQTLIDQGQTKEAYLAVRASVPKSLMMMAARFIYINKLCFNGLYRENLSGKFNVPYGRSSNGADRTFPTIDELTAVKQALGKAAIAVRDANATIAMAKKGDVIYADPPYYDTFSDYTAGGFSDEDHAVLAASLHGAMKRGAIVIASNIDHERVHELYKWAHVTKIEEHHTVAANKKSRGKKDAVLILSDRTLLT